MFCPSDMTRDHHTADVERTEHHRHRRRLLQRRHQPRALDEALGTATAEPG